jgi:acetyl-CoA decarbonylase/synthase complex subunit gamma
MFRHEEKFRNPTGVGFIIDDNYSDSEIKERLKKINQLNFERVGQKLSVNLVAIKQNKDGARYLEATKLLRDNTILPMMLMSDDAAALKQAAVISQKRKPLLYSARQENFAQMGALAKELQLPLVVTALDLDQLSQLTQELNRLGVSELILDSGIKPMADKIWDLTQIRRQALKRSNRALGYPSLAIVEKTDPAEEAMEACAYIAKYAGIVLLKGLATPEVFSILTLRANIYADPQKPLQIDPQLYPIGQVRQDSPVLVTTNFSLSYYTVLGEVESSKIPAYILSVDTQGMSVLTAWAAEKFNAATITKSLESCGLSKLIKHKNLIIPGYVAMISGELEDQSGFRVIVGPKEAAGIPAFLKKLN